MPQLILDDKILTNHWKKLSRGEIIYDKNQLIDVDFTLVVKYFTSILIYNFKIGKYNYKG